MLARGRSRQRARKPSSDLPLQALDNTLRVEGRYRDHAINRAMGMLLPNDDVAFAIHIDSDWIDSFNDDGPLLGPIELLGVFHICTLDGEGVSRVRHVAIAVQRARHFL